MVTKLGKKGFLQYTFFLLMFIAVWALWLGSFLQDYGQTAISENGYTGLEAMFYANLNLWIFLALLAGSFIYYFLGGGGF